MIRHWLSHIFGWNKGRPTYWLHNGTWYSGFQCDVCKGLFHAGVMPKDCQGAVDEPDFWTKYAMVRMGLTADEVTPKIREEAKTFD